ncbi:MAG TPA: FAD:protein FMN transferase [Gemmatimonadota bacterium]|nr:FAD:protein FMN transferase [Gemmatimonadota bacterium]
MRRLRSTLTVIAFAALAGCATAGSTPGLGERLPEPRSVFEDPHILSDQAVFGRHVALSAEVRVVAAAESEEASERALAAAFAAADSLAKLVVPNVETSEIRAINEAAGKSPVRVSPWTERIVLATIRWADRTGGAFDPTIGPLAELWGFGVEVSRAPTDAEIRQALARIGYSKVEVDPEAHTIFLPAEGMRLDVRGAAKGFALDRMKEAMLEAGATSGIIDFAGEMLFFGPGPEDGLWPIVLTDPYDPSRNFAYLLLPPGSLATSSFYDRSVEIAGRRYGHVIDPRTGQPIAGMASATVYTNEGVVADILATGLFVVSCKDGPRCTEAATIVERYPELSAIIVPEPPPGDNAQVTVTTGLRPHVIRLQRPFRPTAEPD